MYKILPMLIPSQFIYIVIHIQMLSNGIMLLKPAYTLQGGVRFSEAIRQLW